MATTDDGELIADPRIDWQRRADGRTHTLRPGKHFHRQPEQVRKAAGMWAHRHGLRCLSQITAAGAVRVKFVPKTEKV
jgi:hypothetical protein